MLVDFRGVAYLSDFGLSRIRHEITRTHTIVRSGGILQFVAPEVSDGKISRGRESSDIYSFAMVIFGLGTGNTPFSHVNNNTVVNRMSNEGKRPVTPESFHGLDRDSTQTLGVVLEKMWQSDPLKRVGAEEVRENLEGLLNGHRTTIFTESLVQNATRDPRPTPEALSFIYQQLDLREPEVEVDRIVAIFDSFDPPHAHLLITRLVENALNSLLPATVSPSSLPSNFAEHIETDPSSQEIPHDRGLYPVETNSANVALEDAPDYSFGEIIFTRLIL